ncbi:alpha/beta fold hydrolase [Cyanobium sp. Cruz CV13-4-11]|nr:alpha/beta fold hydrolase [Cyanobium sp. Cruz CV11-17]MCP9919323.1 alpha/beta fold hydrolase [Cyanobium sp. Cruz CV13-4-11]
MSGRPERRLFLPGASGDTSFWRPLEQRLACRAERLHLGWPGFGDTPPESGVSGFNDLLALVLEPLDRPCALIAQSMGGVRHLRRPANGEAGGHRLAGRLPHPGRADVSSHGLIERRPPLATLPTRWGARRHLLPSLPANRLPERWPCL